MDVLTDVLAALRLKSSVYCRSELGSRWSLEFKAMPSAVFHVLHKGTGYVQFNGETIALRAGDVLLIPSGASHIVSDTLQKSPRKNLAIDRYGECALLRWSEHPTAILLCGSFQFEFPTHHPLLDLLPRIIHIQGQAGQAKGGLESILNLMAAEAQTPSPGQQTILRRLADVLFVQIIRYWVQTKGAQTTGWLGALHDPQIGKALGLIHSRLEQNWTVGSLAEAVTMSRSGFAARFTHLVGEPPQRYLTRWRMQTAATLLGQPRVDMLEVAEQVGYASEVAFSKAFKRELGIAPGAYRRNIRTVHPPPAN